jgi:hypothetical protein
MDGIARLHQAIAQVCPIQGIADLGDGTYRIDFAPEATPEQQQAAQQIADSGVIPAEPNWEQFRSLISINSIYIQVAASHPQNLVLNPLLVALMWRVGEDPRLLLEVMNLWAAMVHNAPISSTQAQTLAQVCQSCNMPFTADDSGQFVPLEAV